MCFRRRWWLRFDTDGNLRSSVSWCGQRSRQINYWSRLLRIRNILNSWSLRYQIGLDLDDKTWVRDGVDEDIIDGNCGQAGTDTVLAEIRWRELVGFKGRLSSDDEGGDDVTMGRFCPFSTGVACLPEKLRLVDLRRTARWFLLITFPLSVKYLETVICTILPLKVWKVLDRISC